MKNRKIIASLLLLVAMYICAYIFTPFINFAIGSNSNVDLINATYVNTKADKVLTFYENNNCDYSYIESEDFLSKKCSFLLDAGLIEIVNQEEHYKFLVLNENEMYSSTFRCYFTRFINEKTN